ncbi:MAG: dienelactone hydrolase family protein [Microbacterium sp.]|uniref:alpha/beta hydrolase family protein n=1 Tax=Microbacterium sp. TaxID=51671 RepID=UPI001AD0FACD|nr:alpha/beta family hydrolase [Microbacterium sp.]MBN9175995.1 dienelactone hydrolase family protein [Microbacterium sp.]
MTQLDVLLPSGAVRVTTAWEDPPSVPAPAAVVALAHGAGAGMDHPFLVGFAAALRDEGVATLRFAFPYREAGRRMPGPPSHAIATWAAVAAEVARRAPGVPFVAAGKSYGGRMASLAAADGVIGPAALVYLGYPFHAPGKPDRTRGEHLARVAAPQLFVEGDADPFIQPIADFEASVAASPDAEIVWIPGGGHSFEVKGRRAAPGEVGAALAPTVAAWLRPRL